MTDTTTPGVSDSKPLATGIIPMIKSRPDLWRDETECTCRVLQPVTVSGKARDATGRGNGRFES